MAKNVTVQGASYTAVPAIDVPQTGGGTARFTDTSVVTATASDVASGKVFVDADGSQVTGTASGGGGALIFSSVYDEQTDISTLDTTWQNIYDAMASGRGAILVFEAEEDGQLVWQMAATVLWVVTETDIVPTRYRVDIGDGSSWSTYSANGYPEQTS